MTIYDSVYKLMKVYTLILLPLTIITLLARNGGINALKFIEFSKVIKSDELGSSPALATCETSQVLLAGVSGGFSRG